MSSSIKNVYQFRTTSKITQAQGAASTFTIGNDVFTNSSVTITGGSVKLENRTGSQVELMTITATGGTATIATRGILPDGTTSTNYQYERPRNTLCTVTVLENQITNKVTANTFTEDQTIESGNKLKLGANAYVWTENDGTDLKFKDASNTEKTLTQLASLSGSNDKVKVSATDTTEGFLNSKITAGDGLSKTTINPAGNEVIDLDIDLTDTTKFSTAGVASRAVVTDGSGNIFQATTSARGGAKTALDATATAGTDESDYINSKQLKNWSGYTIVPEAGTTLAGLLNNLQSANTPRSNTSLTYIKVKEIAAAIAGTYTVYFEIKADVSTTAFGRIYVNGGAVGTERSTTSTSYVGYLENITVTAGQLIQLYYKKTGTNSHYAQNFRLYGFVKPASLVLTVNTD